MSDKTQRLKNALAAMNINASDDIYDALKGTNKWIRYTDRVDTMRNRIQENALYEIFDYDHHFSSAVELFEFLQAQQRLRPRAVVFGQKKQGKSQFLFFLVRLLQQLGEIVLYLDKSILPILQDLTCEEDISDFWDSRGLSNKCKKQMNSFKKYPTKKNFVLFINQLMGLAKSGKRVWIIMDEVVEIYESKLPILLPEEQSKSPFHWVVTGSAGIGSWVRNQHLYDFTFDLPLFSPQGTTVFATELCKHLEINLCEVILGVEHTGISEWLEETFGGVIGYVTEFCFSVKKPEDVKIYQDNLRDRIDALINKAAEKKGTSVHSLSDLWLKKMDSADNYWLYQRDAGLCGRGPPRGVVFSTMLKLLFFYSSKVKIEDALSLVKEFRKKFNQDPGLDGCLLELEEILKLKNGIQFEAARLVLENDEWTSFPLDKVMLPKRKCRVWSYAEDKTLKLLQDEETLKLSQDEETDWNVIELYSGFVLDVVLVDASDESPTIYGIQITRSKDPFQKHHTTETCSAFSHMRLQALWSAIEHIIGIHDYTIVFTMVAPNCENDNFKPTAGHEVPYYFSPASVVFDYLSQGNGPVTKRTKLV